MNFDQTITTTTSFDVSGATTSQQVAVRTYGFLDLLFYIFIILIPIIMIIAFKKRRRR
jgi:hypothetical protein